MSSPGDRATQFDDNSRMNVTVTFTTQLKAAIGSAEQVISLPDDATVKDAIDALAAQYPEHFSNLCSSVGN